MSSGYLVRKRIRGKLYLYRQQSWREGGKVRTKCECLGPIADGEQSRSDVDHAEQQPEFGNPFANRNTTNNEVTFGNPFADAERCNNANSVSPEEYHSELERQAEAAQKGEQSNLPKNLAIDWKSLPRPKNIDRNTTRKLPKGVHFKGSLAHRKISHVALAKEFEGLCRNLSHMGVDWTNLPKIEIRVGKQAGWKKSWLRGRTYIVTIPESGGRTKFKQAYRECLAACFIEELRRQDHAQYKELLKAAGQGFHRGKQIREALSGIIQFGSKKAHQRYKKQTKSKKGWDIQEKGIVGQRTVSALKRMGCDW